MSLLESCWFLVAFLIITIVLLVDPASSTPGFGANSVLGGLATPSSQQKFIYRFSAVLIVSFFTLTTVLSVLN